MSFFLWLILFVLLFLVAVKLYVKLTTGWCRSQVSLVGKTVIITGANTGIGYETAIDLAKRGARVILACRDESRGKEAVQKIIRDTNNSNVFYKHLDLASLKSVREFADDINKTEPQLDILINNAGAFGLNGKTEDGINRLLQVNHLGHFLLTNLLLDLLKKSTPSRIINVSSMAAKRQTSDSAFDVHTKISDPLTKEHIQYGITKLCNILFTIQLNEQLQGTGVSVFSLHPGVIATEFTRLITGFRRTLIEIILKTLFKDPVEGAQTTIYCAVQKGIEYLSGEHFADCDVVERYPSALNAEAPKALWKQSATLVKLGN